MTYTLKRTLDRLDSYLGGRAVAADVLRDVFGGHAAAKIQRYLLETDPKTHIQRQAVQRERAAVKMWKRIETELRRKRTYAAAKLARAQSEPQQRYYTHAVAGLDMAQTFLQKHWQQALAANGKMPTPAQYCGLLRMQGRSFGLPRRPPGGNLWLEWFPLEFIAESQGLAQACLEERSSNMARPPRLFHMHRTQQETARKQALYDTLTADIEAAQIKRATLLSRPELDDSGKPLPEFMRRVMATHVEEKFSEHCKSQLDKWPRTRKIPLDPAQLSGARLNTVLASVRDYPEPLVMDMELADLDATATGVLRHALTAAKQRKEARDARNTRSREKVETRNTLARPVLAEAERMVGTFRSQK